MHPFQRLLVERLAAGTPVLSRNRQFHTLSSPEGRAALRLARQLRSLAKDIAASGEPPRLAEEPDERVRIEVRLRDGWRRAIVPKVALEILRQLPLVQGLWPPTAR